MASPTCVLFGQHNLVFFFSLVFTYSYGGTDVCTGVQELYYGLVLEEMA
jgi:hypothetical protein